MAEKKKKVKKFEHDEACMMPYAKWLGVSLTKTSISLYGI